MSSPVDQVDIYIALSELSRVPCFPKGAKRVATGVFLKTMCPHREALQWLVQQFVDRIGIWHGLDECRAVLCWKYRPADGIEVESNLCGYRAWDAEQYQIERQARLKAAGCGSEDHDLELAIQDVAERKRIL